MSFLQGTGVALVTPFKTNGTVDFDALGKVIDYVIEGGVQYLVTLGTTGETPTLSAKEKIEIAHYTFEKTNNRVPVIVGIGGNNTAELIKEVQSFPLQNAVAVLSASPYYNKPTQEGLFLHYKALAEASPKPIILYNVPGRTGRNISAATVIKLANEVPNIIGLKEAGGDMLQCMEILKDKPKDFIVVSGDDVLALPQLACGMSGVISVIANSHPKEFSAMVQYCLQGNFANAKAINDTLIPVYDFLFTENNPAGVKAYMYKKGLLENVLRLPLTPVSNELMERINTQMK